MSGPIGGRPGGGKGAGFPDLLFGAGSVRVLDGNAASAGPVCDAFAVGRPDRVVVVPVVARKREPGGRSALKVGDPKIAVRNLVRDGKTPVRGQRDTIAADRGRELAQQGAGTIEPAQIPVAQDAGLVGENPRRAVGSGEQNRSIAHRENEKIDRPKGARSDSIFCAVLLSNSWKRCNLTILKFCRRSELTFGGAYVERLVGNCGFADRKVVTGCILNRAGNLKMEIPG